MSRILSHFVSCSPFTVKNRDDITVRSFITSHGITKIVAFSVLISIRPFFLPSSTIFFLGFLLHFFLLFFSFFNFWLIVHEQWRCRGWITMNEDRSTSLVCSSRWFDVRTYTCCLKEDISTVRMNISGTSTSFVFHLLFRGLIILRCRKDRWISRERRARHKRGYFIIENVLGSINLSCWCD